MKKGDEVYVWSIRIDENGNQMLRKDDKGEEVPDLGWHTFIFDFYGLITRVGEDGRGGYFPISNHFAYGYFKNDPSRKMMALPITELHLIPYERE